MCIATHNSGGMQRQLRTPTIKRSFLTLTPQKPNSAGNNAQKTPTDPPFQHFVSLHAYCPGFKRRSATAAAYPVQHLSSKSMAAIPLFPWRHTTAAYPVQHLSSKSMIIISFHHDILPTWACMQEEGTQVLLASGRSTSPNRSPRKCAKGGTYCASMLCLFCSSAPVETDKCGLNPSTPCNSRLCPPPHQVWYTT